MSELKRKTALRRTPFKSEPKPADGTRKRKCAICRTPFEPRSITHKACGEDCAKEVAKQVREKQCRKEEKAQRAVDKAKKESLKPLSFFEKKAERACNEYIRLRDEGNGCISCGTMTSPSFQAGHYKSVGSNPTIRYNEDNIWLQCSKCNVFWGGNVIEYRKNLIEKIGLERVEALEGWHPPIKMTRELALEIEAHFKKKLKELKAQRAG